MANFRTIGADFSEALKTPHYTNGRLLTAEDLQQEQQYNIERHAHLGKAAGYGIVEGFNVSAVSNSTALSITSGLGLNRRGDVVHLATEKVSLPVQPVTDDDDGSLRRSARFDVCETGDDDQPAPVSTGAYLLTAAPVAQMEGSVPRRACDGTNTAACANQWEVDGIEFKIIRLTDYEPPVGNKSGRNRNLLAHYFYGSEQINRLMRDPLQFPANYTGFSKLPAADFNECDLPLAAFYWSGGKIVFIDEWAVRRRMMHPYPADKWAANISDQRTAEGEARYLQFQKHIADLQLKFGNKTDTVRAVDHFAYLPPVGILPVNPFELIVADVFDKLILERQDRVIAEMQLEISEVLDRVRAGVLGSLGSKNAYNIERFFGDLLSPDYLIVHEDYVHDRLHQSWVQPPILLPPPPVVEVEAGYFDLVLADGSKTAVYEDNFEQMILNMHNKFSGSVFTHKVKALDKAAGVGENVGHIPDLPMEEPAGRRIGRALRGRTETVPSMSASAAEAHMEEAGTNDNIRLIAELVNKHKTFRPPKEIFVPERGDDDEVEPLIDILVVDELLDPYRERLAEEMVGRIDDAIAVLIGDGTIFTGDNHFKHVNNSIANAFVLNQFLWQAANYGYVAIDGLLQLIQNSTPPVFYVVFARHRARVERRPLRL